MADLTLQPDNTLVARQVAKWDSQTVSDLSLSDPYINDATVTFNLYDKDGTQLITDLSLSYVSGSDGIYRGLVANDTGIQMGRRYRATWKAVTTEGYEWTTQEWITATSPT